MSRDELFRSGDNTKIWAKYCGFLDLTLDDFMLIQKSLLRDQLNLFARSPLNRQLMTKHMGESIDEFRKLPLTTYTDYELYMGKKDASLLPVKPVVWARTSGKTGYLKWAPYSANQLTRLAEDTITAFILASAREKGEVRLKEGARIVLNLPPVPYVSGIMAAAAKQRLSYRAIPPLEQSENMTFEERILKGFNMALDSGVDYAASMAAVLVKVGEDFARIGRSSGVPFLPLHPAASLRILRGLARARLARRPILPRDLWSLSGLVCGGTDTSIYRDRIAEYWGIQPLDVYVATETGYIAMQAWDKSGMTFVPFSNFYEFIPEDEYLKSQHDQQYQPATLLMNEVEPGKKYELVVTNFNGGPFMRYRLGDLIKITSLKNSQAGINLPQMSFHSRINDIIDISGFARLDEKTLWKAIHGIQIPCEEWSARKEYIRRKPILHFYLELHHNGVSEEYLADLIDAQLMGLDADYRDLRSIAGISPVLVTRLSAGTFKEYTEIKRASGADLAHLKPPHMNPTDEVVTWLLKQSNSLAIN